MSYLEAVRALPTTQPIEVYADEDTAVLSWPLGGERLVVRFRIDGTTAVILATDIRPGWYLDSGTWEQMTNTLWRWDGDEDAPGSRTDYDQALTEFRQHLDSLGWLVRLIVEATR